MRIAFVSPRWHQMVNSYPPLGLGYLAALMERAGHQVAIFDMGLDPSLSYGQEVERILAFRPEIMGLTAMTNNVYSVFEMLHALRTSWRGPVIIGGPHATLFPEQVLANGDIDYVVVGEGEETLVELVGALAAHNLRPDATVLRGIRGLCFRDGQDVVCNAARSLISDLDALPFPARHLYDLERYPLYAANGERMVTLLSSRGCPYNCSYCFKGIVGRTYRQRSPENVLAEMRQLIETYGYQHFYFIDDLFTLDTKRLQALTSAMIGQGLDVRWQCLARVDRIRREDLAMMYRAGCREVHFGIESGNAGILAGLDKRITMAQVRQAVGWAAEIGIAAKGYFMLGLPGDTEETMRQTIAFACELPLDQAMFSLTTPFPGTRLWDELVARRPELASDQDFSQAFYYTQNTDAIKPFFNVSEVSDQRLSELMVEAQQAFQESVRRRKYVRSLGPTVGPILFSLSTWPPLRRVGHALLRSSALKKARGLGQLGAYNWREENARKWS